MGTFIVLSDATLGYQFNDFGIKTPVQITNGQMVTGDVTPLGLLYKIPSQIMGTGKPLDGMDKFYIPISNLKEYIAPSSSTNVTIPKSDKTFEYVVMGGLAIILTLGVLKILKVI